MKWVYLLSLASLAVLTTITTGFAGNNSTHTGYPPQNTTKAIKGESTYLSPDLAMEGLHGKVKRVTLQRYYTNKNFDIEGENFLECDTINYTRKGKMLNYRTYDLSKPIYQQCVKRNRSGQIERFECREIEDPSGMGPEIYLDQDVITYDELGHKTKVKNQTIVEESESTYHYDSEQDGLLIRLVIHKKFVERTEYSDISYTYTKKDEHGNWLDRNTTNHFSTTESGYKDEAISYQREIRQIEYY